MESLSVHMTSSLTDPFYDMSVHNSGYLSYPSTGNTAWSGRDDTLRSFHQQSAEFESGVSRFTGTGSRKTYPVETTGSKTITDISNPEMEQSDWTNEDTKDVKKSDQGSPRTSQVAVTLTWLSENYERAEGVCLPRCVLYQHYLDFCKKMKFTPAGAATFGKIIRQRFPKLTTRRLGTRGQSKYHYYGIGIKETSIYYHSVYSGKGLTRFSGIKLKTEGSSRKYSLSSKTGTLLPEFPDAENLILPAGTNMDKMKTFIMMYRTHCQRILDTMISANFEEVQTFLVHFWQGMPEHLLDLLSCDILTDVIALCDVILYKVLVDVLIPSTIQELPQSLYMDMRMFCKKLPHWLETSMENIPDPIKNIKIQVAKGFILSLKRQSSFVQLAQTTRTVLSSQDLIGRMVKDISDVDFEDICSQAGFLDPSANPKFVVKLQEFYSEFTELLGKQSSIETYTEWIDDIVDKIVIQPSEETPDLFKEKAAEFILQWGAFGGLLMRELTLKNAKSFASIHLVHLMLDEYAFLVIETQHEHDIEKQYQRKVQKYMKNEEEIQTKAIVRNSSSKLLNSPKCKKRKHNDDCDHDESFNLTDNVNQSSNLTSGSECRLTNGTAFTRPVPSQKENQSADTTNQSDSSRNNAISVQPLKPYQPYNNSYDRPTYLPQFGIGSYSEYVGPNSSFNVGRIPSYSESFSQQIPSNPFTSNITSVGGSYWSDGRSHHSFSDPYQSSVVCPTYNKLSATYDSINKNTLFRNNAYQDSFNSFNRQAFDSSRTLYRGSHENIQVGTPLQMGTYGNNGFMDIAQPAGQYCYQDDLFPPTMGSTFAKPYLSTPFR